MNPIKNPLTEFYHKLAIELGLSLTQVRQLPASEIREWQRYFTNHLFTRDTVEFQLAQIAFILYNANASEKMEFEKFFPKPEPPKVIEDTEEMVVRKMEMLRVLLGKEG